MPKPDVFIREKNLFGSQFSKNQFCKTQKTAKSNENVGFSKLLLSYC